MTNGSCALLGVRLMLQPSGHRASNTWRAVSFGESIARKYFQNEPAFIPRIKHLGRVVSNHIVDLNKRMRKYAWQMAEQRELCQISCVQSLNVLDTLLVSCSQAMSSIFAPGLRSWREYPSQASSGEELTISVQIGANITYKNVRRIGLRFGCVAWS